MIYITHTYSQIIFYNMHRIVYTPFIPIVCWKHFCFSHFTSSRSVMNYINHVNIFNSIIYYHIFNFKMSIFEKKVKWFASLDITVSHLQFLPQNSCHYQMFNSFHLPCSLLMLKLMLEFKLLLLTVNLPTLIWLVNSVILTFMSTIKPLKQASLKIWLLNIFVILRNRVLSNGVKQSVIRE